jgi:hypothetical protein
MNKKMAMLTASTHLRKVMNYVEKKIAVRTEPSSEAYETRSLIWNVYSDKVKR